MTTTAYAVRIGRWRTVLVELVFRTFVEEIDHFLASKDVQESRYAFALDQRWFADPGGGRSTAVMRARATRTTYWKPSRCRWRPCGRLEQTVLNAERWMDNVCIQYLPDELANLQLSLRLRVTDILCHDDEGSECRIDQIALQKAWDR